MSATHIKTVIVQLDGYEATGSRGGNVIETFDLMRNWSSVTDKDGNIAVPSSLVPYVENWEGNASERVTLKSQYKLVELADDHADVDNVDTGWILDAETGTTLRFAG